MDLSWSGVSSIVLHLSLVLGHGTAWLEVVGVSQQLFLLVDLMWGRCCRLALSLLRLLIPYHVHIYDWKVVLISLILAIIVIFFIIARIVAIIVSIIVSIAWRFD